MSSSEAPMLSPPEPPAFPLAPTPAPPWRVATPLAIALAGILVLTLVAHVERPWHEMQPWNRALVALDRTSAGEDPAFPVKPIWVRIASRKEAAPGDAALSALEEWWGQEGLDIELTQAEHIIAIDMPREEFAPLIASGRLPESGVPEVLAGDLARDAPFSLDGTPFKIVGHLHQSVSGLSFAYVLPYDPGISRFFTEDAGATSGWIDPEGLDHLEALFPGEKDQETRGETPKILGGITRTKPAYAWITLAGLLAVAFGGALAYMRCFARLASPPTLIFGPVLEETVRRPRLLAGLHIILYGIFFAAMALGITQPLLNYRMANLVGAVFTEGGLSYIGDAYASGNVLRATLATFYNNYVVQTLGLTFAISIAPLALGVLKTALSFAVVGFAMAPLWAGTAANYLFHSVTMALELEAYILASFVVLVWAFRLFRTDGEPFGARFVRSVQIFVGGAILAGVMLAIAALYEATTLILIVGYA